MERGGEEYDNNSSILDNDSHRDIDLAGSHYAEEIC